MGSCKIVATIFRSRIGSSCVCDSHELSLVYLYCSLSFLFIKKEESSSDCLFLRRYVRLRIAWMTSLVARGPVALGALTFDDSWRFLNVLFSICWWLQYVCIFRHLLVYIRGLHGYPPWIALHTCTIRNLFHFWIKLQLFIFAHRCSVICAHHIRQLLLQRASNHIFDQMF